MPMLQRILHEQLKAQSIATRERIGTLVQPLDGGRLVERSGAAGWSVGEVLEHLCISDELYDAPLAHLRSTARADAGAPVREWKPSFLGNLLANMLEKPRPMRAPKAFQPGPTPRAGVLEQFLGKERALVQMMDDTASLDWRALKVVSPALPSWMPKFNLGDVYRIHVVHVARHLGQIERVLKQR